MIEMVTKIKKANENSIKEAAKLLRAGEVIGIPTETVYGLGANALDVEAVKKIFEVKGRPMDNPLIVHIGRKEDVSKYAYLTDEAEKIIEALWPGPLTLVLKKREIISQEITAGLDTVAIRMPENKVARDIINEAGVPVAAPSANISGKPSPTRASHVKADLDGKIELIIDGGDSEVGLESTVLDISGEIPVILRPGKITAEDLRDFGVRENKEKKFKDDEAPKAPGMKYKHYAPKADIVILEGEREKVLEEINKKAEDSLFNSVRLGVIIESEYSDKITAKYVYELGSTEDEDTSAKNLFAVLRQLDEDGIDLALVPKLSDKGIGKASMNRLLKAANHNVRKV